MTRLAGTVDGVIGVDPHRDTLAAAVTDPVGGLLARTSVSADAVGYQRLLAFTGRKCQDGAAGRSRAPAATAPGLLPCSRRMGSGWWRPVDPSDSRGAPAPTPSRPHQGRSSGIG
jgi:hypothetical protein